MGNKLFMAARLVVAAAIVAAVVVQLRRSLATWQEQAVPEFSVLAVNFFSFFTIQSNIASVVVLAAGAWILLTSRHGRCRFAVAIEAPRTTLSVGVMAAAVWCERIQ